ncbi:MAG: hypothetical protein KBD64_04970, partial [Gammaproteobacteria bacterium]|nr:hypothetical protein [Gammaproteobacteria bacterium]
LVIAKFITIFNILNLIFLAVYIKNFSQYFEKINKNNFKLILFAFILNFLLPTGFLYLIFVITGRYYLLSAILLLLFVPFGMDYIWIKVNNLLDYPKFRILSQSCLIALLALLAADGITTFGYSKDYIKQAGLWYKAQNLPTETAIANNPQLAYFAELSNNSIEYDQLVPSQINKNYFSYLLIKIKYNDTNKLTQIKQLAENNQLIILNTFSNSRNDSVFICKLI